MLALDAMVDQDLFICPRCGSRVRPEDGAWHCAGASLRLCRRAVPGGGRRPRSGRLRGQRARRGPAAGGRGSLGGAALPVRRATAPAAAPGQHHGARERRADGGAAQGRHPRPQPADPGDRRWHGRGRARGAVRRPTIDLISFDVYASPATQFVGDGHSIPLADGSVDGVIVQAVLEHVLEPTIVADEIHRVLRTGGIVYADTPFLQQVHEGAYDFTRFTDSRPPVPVPPLRADRLRARSRARVRRCAGRSTTSSAR